MKGEAMPCMGPSVNEQEVAKATQEIEDILYKKYRLLECEPVFSRESSLLYRDNVQRRLKAAIRAVFQCDANENF